MTASNIPLRALHMPPRITVGRTALRELRSADALSLTPLLQDPDVRRFMPGAPKNAMAFQRFAAWAERQRERRGHLCLAIAQDDVAVGLIQAWSLEPRGQTMEWGFALGRPYWGRGLFHEAARAFITFAVTQLGVHRLEARTAAPNIRGMAALLRLGAQPEGLLRQCFPLEGARVDCTLWSILACEWKDTSHTSLVDVSIRVPAPALESFE